MNEYQAALKELQMQKEEIQFTSFTNDTALAIGMALLQEAKKHGKAVAIDITRSGQQLFHFAMEGTAIDNGEWIKRKNNVVRRFGHSSYYMGTYLKSAGQTMEEKYLLPSSNYAAHGGAFPLIVQVASHRSLSTASLVKDGSWLNGSCGKRASSSGTIGSVGS